MVEMKWDADVVSYHHAYNLRTVMEPDVLDIQNNGQGEYFYGRKRYFTVFFLPDYQFSPSNVESSDKGSTLTQNAGTSRLVGQK